MDGPLVDDRFTSVKFLSKRKLILLAVLFIGVIAGLIIYFLILNKPIEFNRTLKIREWFVDPDGHVEWTVKAGERCGNAPFLIPTDGLIGYLWGDHFKIGAAHQGIDIFGGFQAGITPVIAVYNGYLTRLADWKSSVIIRIPSDPLQLERQIWTYYTHMADREGRSFISTQFPEGSNEVFVKAGTLLGYQGDYSGTQNNPVWVHLHFSIVKDNGKGAFLNELDIQNTYDPSPYLGLILNTDQASDSFPTCTEVKTHPTP
jgi:hypothetical protein